MDNQKQELLQKLKDANNVLVTVSSNPSVDQLASCIGLTLLLNKLHKHATAVFSGQVPSTLEFLKPEETLEKNTDSLRDFIVSLDKSKADKLRYKVEDNVVKIFITPYKTSISEADLDFSQGDFNIDVVVCIGIDKQADLDQAITSHGRILHDATVISVSVGAAGELGTLNWVEPQASSLSEITAQIADSIGKEQIDGQIATSLLTGIVAETDRFSNEKTSPVTMQLASELMAAGANQQLVANELKAESKPLDPAESNEMPQEDQLIDDQVKVDQDGTLEIGHTPDGQDGDTGPDVLPPAENPDQPLPPTDDGAGSPQLPPVNIDETPAEQPPAGPAESPDQPPTSRLVLQPPSMGGQLTANSEPESFDPSVDPLSLLNNNDTPMLSHTPQAPENPATPPPAAQDAPEPPAQPEVKPEEGLKLDAPVVDLPAPVAEPLAAVEPLPAVESLPPAPEPEPSEPAPAAPPFDAGEKSLSELEEAVDSPHLHAVEVPPPAPAPEPPEDIDALRDAVLDAANSGPQNSLPQPTQSVGSEGYLNVQDIPDTTDDPVTPPAAPALEPGLTIPAVDPTPPTSVEATPSTAPPVPPPLEPSAIDQIMQQNSSDQNAA